MASNNQFNFVFRRVLKNSIWFPVRLINSPLANLKTLIHFHIVLLITQFIKKNLVIIYLIYLEILYFFALIIALLFFILFFQIFVWITLNSGKKFMIHLITFILTFLFHYLFDLAKTNLIGSYFLEKIEILFVFHLLNFII